MFYDVTKFVPLAVVSPADQISYAQNDKRTYENCVV